jgi:hypothetical protein
MEAYEIWKVENALIKYVYCVTEYTIDNLVNTEHGCIYANNWALKDELCFNPRHNRSVRRDALCGYLSNDFQLFVNFTVLLKTNRRRY